MTNYLTGLSLRWKTIIGIFIFYGAFSFLYNIVLWYNGRGFEDGTFTFLNLRDYWFRAGFQYVFMFFASVCIWLIGVKLLQHKPTRLQIIAVFFLTPVIIFGERELRYVILDALGKNRLQSTGTIWDWYIPLLFLYFQFGAFFALKYFRENQRKLRLEGELRQYALKSELAAIKAQLNPHFLYNIFNTINASIPTEHEKTRHLIAQLSDLFRYQLQASKEDLVPLREEISFISKYLELEKERFGERLSINIDVADELLAERIPPMLLQPLVENSIKHGLASLIEGGNITIRIFKKGEKLMFEVADTGVGVEDTTTLFDIGIGLTNTRLRLMKMYQAQLEILKNKPQGLLVRFSI